MIFSRWKELEASGRKCERGKRVKSVGERKRGHRLHNPLFTDVSTKVLSFTSEVCTEKRMFRKICANTTQHNTTTTDLLPRIMAR